MTIEQFMLVGAALSLFVCALVHSVAGEKKLIGPLLGIEDVPLLAHPLARFVIRFAWHLTSVALTVIALALLAGTFLSASQAIQLLPLLVGIAFLGSGVYDAIYSKGKHIGWPFLCLTGFFGLTAWLVSL